MCIPPIHMFGQWKETKEPFQITDQTGYPGAVRQLCYPLCHHALNRDTDESNYYDHLLNMSLVIYVLTNSPDLPRHGFCKTSIGIV